MTHPASIAFLLDREFPKILAWHQGKRPISDLGVAAQFIQSYETTVSAWVEHNLAHCRQVGGCINKPQTRFLEFWDQSKRLGEV